MQSNLTAKFSRLTWYQDILILMILITSLFTFMLGSRPLNVPDEARYTEIPLEMISSHDYITPHLDGIKYFEKPALFYWMQTGAIKLLGKNNWAYRITTAMMAMLGCLLIYAGGRLLFNRRTGWLATGILTTNILYFTFAHVVTLDMTLSVFMTGTLLSFIAAMRYPPGNTRRYLMWSCYIFAALAVMTKGLVGIILPGFIVLTWLALFNEWRQLKSCYLISGIMLFLLIALPWHIAVQIKNPEFYYFYFIQQQFTRYLTNYAGRFKPFWFFIPIIIIGLYPWVCFLVQAIKFNLPQHWRDRFSYKESIFLLIWATTIFVFFSLSKSKLIPYIVPTIPPLALLIGYYLASDPDKNTGITRGFKILPFFTIIMAIATLIGIHYVKTTQSHFVIISEIIMGSVATIGSFLALWVKAKYNTIAAFATQLITSICFLLILTVIVPYIDMGSIAPLAQVLNPLLKPNDVVASYCYYYQDLPVYLNKRIMIVNWQNELSFGIAHQDAHQWIIDAPTFWKLWSSPKSFYMITTRHIYQTRLIGQHEPLHILAQTNHDVLLANH